MRNSNRQYNQFQENDRVPPHRKPVLLLILVSTAAWLAPTAGAEPDFSIRSEHMLVVQADEAWEESEGETLRFAGNFEMRVRDWLFQSDSAVLEGAIDDPTSVSLKGSPARIHLAGADPAGLIQGEAQEIVYQRDPGTVQLIGGAKLEQGENRLQSTRIDYDINSDRVRAVGRAEVELRIRP